MEEDPANDCCWYFPVSGHLVFEMRESEAFCDHTCCCLRFFPQEEPTNQRGLPGKSMTHHFWADNIRLQKFPVIWLVYKKGNSYSELPKEEESAAQVFTCRVERSYTWFRSQPGPGIDVDVNSSCSCILEILKLVFEMQWHQDSPISLEFRSKRKLQQKTSGEWEAAEEIVGYHWERGRPAASFWREKKVLEIGKLTFSLLGSWARISIRLVSRRKHSCFICMG